MVADDSHQPFSTSACMDQSFHFHQWDRLPGCNMSEGIRKDYQYELLNSNELYVTLARPNDGDGYLSRHAGVDGRTKCIVLASAGGRKMLGDLCQGTILSSRNCHRTSKPRIKYNFSRSGSWA